MPEQSKRELGEEDRTVAHENVRYQVDDAPAGPIIKFGAWLLVLAIVAHVVTGILYFVYMRHEDLRQAPLSPIMSREKLEFPRDLERVPRPHLRTNDVLSLEQLRREEDARLNSYGWVDAQNGVVRLPIAEAMKRLTDPATAQAHGIRTESEKAP